MNEVLHFEAVSKVDGPGCAVYVLPGHTLLRLQHAVPREIIVFDLSIPNDPESNGRPFERLGCIKTVEDIKAYVGKRRALIATAPYASVVTAHHSAGSLAGPVSQKDLHLVFRTPCESGWGSQAAEAFTYVFATLIDVAKERGEPFVRRACGPFRADVLHGSLRGADRGTIIHGEVYAEGVAPAGCPGDFPPRALDLLLNDVDRVTIVTSSRYLRSGRQKALPAAYTPAVIICNSESVEAWRDAVHRRSPSAKITIRADDVPTGGSATGENPWLTGSEREDARRAEFDLESDREDEELRRAVELLREAGISLGAEQRGRK